MGVKTISVEATSVSSLGSPSIHGSLTGASCGVDSLSLIRHCLSELGEGDFSYLIFNNAGSHGSANSQHFFQERAERAFELAARVGKPIVLVDSNMGDFLTTHYVHCHTLLNGAIAHLFAGIGSRYYYASGGFGLRGIYCPLDGGCIAHTDAFLLPLISSSQMILSQPEILKTRFDKIESLVDCKIAQDLLDVCVDHESTDRQAPNCGKCEKCIRTLLMLEVLGAISHFERRFDIEAFHESRDSFLVKVANSPREERRVVIDMLVKNKKSLPAITKFCHHFPGVRIPSKFLIWMAERVT